MAIESRVLRTIETEGVEAAIEDYRAVRERYHGSALAEAYCRLGDIANARALYEEMLQAYPNDRRIKQQLAALEKLE